MTISGTGSSHKRRGIQEEENCGVDASGGSGERKLEGLR